MSGFSTWSWLLGGAMTGLIGYANLPVSWIVPLQSSVSTSVLASAKLKPLLNAPSLSETSDIWQKSGAVVMAVRRPG